MNRIIHSKMRIFIFAFLLATALASPEGYHYDRPSKPFPQPPSSTVHGYNYPKPSNSFSLPNEVPHEQIIITTERQRPTNPQPLISLSSSIPVRKGYQYPKPSQPFTLPNELATVITSRPYVPTITYSPSTSQSITFPPPPPPPKPTLTPVRKGYDYPIPSQPFRLPNEVVISSGIPIKATTPVRKGYQYARPNQPFTLPNETPTVITSKPYVPTITYAPVTSRPVTFSPTPPPPKPTLTPIRKGYEYPRPSQPFTLSNELPTIITSRPYVPTVTYAPVTSRPVTFPPTNPPPKPTLTPIRKGYEYPKPSQPFALPNELPTVITSRPYVPTVTFSPVTSRPVTIQPTFPPPKVTLTPIRKGYQYPKPSRPFTLPNELPTVITSRPYVPTVTYAPVTSRPVTFPPTNPPPKPALTPVRKGYNYPKPSQPFTLPIEIQTSSVIPIIATPIRKGYQYPKPSQPFTLPNESPTVITSRPYVHTVTYTPVTSRPITFPPPPPPPKPTLTTVRKGYHYPKPSQPFTLPNDIPTSSLVSVLSTSPIQKGYQYPKPGRPFTLLNEIQTVITSRPYVPTETYAPLTSRPIASPQSNPSISISPQLVSSTGYHYPKPSNPIILPEPTATYIPPTYRPVTLPPAPPPPKPSISIRPQVVTSTYVPLQTIPSQVSGYHYPRPSNPITLPEPTVSYIPPTYRPLTFPQATPSPIPSISFRPLVTSTYAPLPTIPSKVSGYHYPKPNNPIILSEPTESYIPPTYRPVTLPPAPPPPKPSISIRPQIVTSTYVPLQTIPSQVSGYHYPRPSNPIARPEPTVSYVPPTYRPVTLLPVPPSQKPTIAVRPQVVTSSYVPPQPIPSKISGYHYPKPSNPIILPELTVSYIPPTYRPVTLPPTPPSPKPTIAVRPQVVTSSYIPPQPTLSQVSGYHYPKPSNPIILPEPTATYIPPTYRPVTFPPAPPPPKPSISIRPQIVTSTYVPLQTIPSQVSGYHYPRPSNPITLPEPTVSYIPPTYSHVTLPPALPSPIPTISFRPQVVTSTYIPPRPISTQVPGYQYPRPSNPIKLPEPTVTYIPPTYRPVTLPPAPPPPKPSISIPPSQPIRSQISGYQYPKPSIPFTVPARPTSSPTYYTPSPTPIQIATSTTQTVYRPSSIPIPSSTPSFLQIPSTTFDIEHQPILISSTRPPRPPTPKPTIEIGLSHPTKTAGYQYPRPSNPLTLPINPVTQFEYSSSPILVSSTLPSLPKPTIEITSPHPIKSSGYHYDKPSNPLQLPSHSPTTFEINSSPIIISSTLPPSPPPPKPTIEISSPNPIKTAGYQYPRPSNPLTLPTYPVTPTVAVSSPITISSTFPPSTLPTIEITSDQPIKISGYRYPKPTNPFTLPTHTTPTLEIGSSPIIISSTLPPAPPPPKPTIEIAISQPIKTGGYRYPKPSNPLTLPTLTPTPFEIASSPVIISSTLPPPPPPPIPTIEVALQQPIKTTGYNYPKPSNPLTLPTHSPTSFELDSSPVIISSSLPPSTPSPQPTIEIAIPHPTKTAGYRYPKPSNPLTLPTQTPTPFEIASSPVIISSTLPPPPPPPKPTIEISIPHPTKTAGYRYPKPSNPLTLPTQSPTPIEIASSPIIISSTLPPPPPPPVPTIDVALPQPTKTGGYNYPKPSNPLTLPTHPSTILELVSSPIIISSTVPPPPPPPKPTVEIKSPQPTKTAGYHYPRPNNPFTLPSHSPTPILIDASTTETIYNPPIISIPSESSSIFSISSTTPEIYIEPVVSTASSPPPPPPPKPTLSTTFKPSTLEYEPSVKPGGYHYPKPDVEFTLPASTSPNPTIEIVKPPKFNGYLYDPPSIPFEK